MQTNYLKIIWRIFLNADSWPHFRPTESEFLGAGGGGDQNFVCLLHTDLREKIF